MPTSLTDAGRLRVLADLSVAFARTHDYRTLLDTIASRTAELVGDGCLVTMIAADGETLVSEACAHRDPKLAEIYRAFIAGRGTIEKTSKTVAAEVIRTGVPKLVGTVAPQAVADSIEPSLRDLAIQLDVHSFLVVPIRSREEVVGSLSLFRSRPGRGYTEADQLMVEDLAERTGLAIGQARLFSALQDREAQLRQVLEATPTGMLTIDPSGRIALVNAAVEQQFGYTRAELLGQPVEILLPERLREQHGGLRATYLARPSTRAMGAGRELFGRRKDGSEFPIEIGLDPLHTGAGTFVLATIVDISERKRAERERDELFDQLRTLNTVLEERVRERTATLATTLREREVLLQEVHHRVKNNLQVISSLINMQLRKLSPSVAREALEDFQTRVLAIALIHEQLYQSHDYARVEFAEYVRSLAPAVLRANNAASHPIELVLAVAAIPLRVDVAIPCGLVLVELVTNALKHAFRDRESGTVRIELVADGARLCLRVVDDGVGLPPGLDPARAGSTGLRLVSTLCAQLRGDLDITTSERGTAFQLTFPADDRA